MRRARVRPVKRVRQVLVLETGALSGWAFECPGCGLTHHVTPSWTFNGDLERPTFSPSLLIRGYEFLTDEEHARLMRGEPIVWRPLVCHSFVTDGRIQFLADSTHALAGQTVDLPEVTP